MIDFGALILLGFAIFAAIRMIARHNQRAPDPLIDDLIARNRARFIDGMHAPDWIRVKSIGAKNWKDAVEAQARQ